MAGRARHGRSGYGSTASRSTSGWDRTPRLPLRKRGRRRLRTSGPCAGAMTRRTRVRQSTVPTFEAAAEAVIELRAGSWRNPNTAGLWRGALQRFAYPKIGRKPVDAITTADVLVVLRPIWNSKRGMAEKVRQAISGTMKAAIAEGHRADDPTGPALRAALPKTNGTAKHHKALPHAEVGDAIRRVQDLGAAPTITLMFEYITLTACRAVRRETQHGVR